MNDCRGCGVRGTFWLEGAAHDLGSFCCECDPEPYDQDDPWGGGTNGPPDAPSVEVRFSQPVVIFEDAYANSPTETVARRSTSTSVTVSAWGGDSGGFVVVTAENIDRLVPTGSLSIPTAFPVAPYTRRHITVGFEGALPSGAADDIVVHAALGTATASASATAVKVEIRATIDPPDEDYRLVNRHVYGVGEQIALRQSPMSPTVNWNPIGGGSNLTSRSETLYFCPLLRCANPLRAECGGMQYTPLLSVIEPTSIKAELWNGTTRDSIYTYSAGKGQAGGIGMRLRLFVRPFSVSFMGVKIEEVPQLTYRASGYFNNPYFNGAFAHIPIAGAGNWLRVNADNSFGDDEAAYTHLIPWLTPSGQPTTNSAFAWTEGTVDIDNPFGWGSPNCQRGDLPCKMFATDVVDEIMLTASGTVGVRKLFNQITRSTNDLIRLNGVLIR